jgi:predicted O-methyltransferase YrrM
MPGWVMHPDDVRLLRARVEGLAPSLAVECGSGQTTQVLREVARWVISLEHDGKWAADTREFVTATNGEVRCVPLRDRWYQTVLPDGIGFALIDGPPGYIGRDLTLPNLLPHLAPGAVVWLDDVDRREERRIIDAWCEEFDLSWHGVGKRVGEIVLPAGRLTAPGGS